MADMRTVPFFCMPCTDSVHRPHWVFWMALKVPETLAECAKKSLQKTMADKKDNRWIVYSADLPATMRKAPGITPSYYCSTQIIPAKPKEKVLSQSDFLRFAYESSGIADFSVFQAVWTAIVDAIPSWLLKTMRPIDFGYFKILAVPFRMNWKLNLLAAFPRIKSVFSHPKKIVSTLFDTLGVTEDLRNTKNMAVKSGPQGRTFGWTVDVLPSKRWTVAVATLENARAGAFPGVQYVKQWGAIVGKLLPYLQDLIEHASREIATPAGAIHKDDGKDRQSLVECFDPKGVRLEVMDRMDGDLVGDPLEGSVTDGSGGKVALRSDAPLSPVSFVRVRDANLRPPWRDVRKRVRPDGTTGMLVLSSSGDKPSDKGLLEGS